MRVVPDVQFSIAQGNEFANAGPDVQGYAAELFTLLVQIAQWLALARGHAAVHLFCDICRLFSVSGVDDSNAAQTAFCAHLLAMEVWPGESGRSDPRSAGFAAGSYDLGLVGAAGHGNSQLGRILIGVESLFHRVGDDGRRRRRRSVRGVAGRRFEGLVDGHRVGRWVYPHISLTSRSVRPRFCGQIDVFQEEEGLE